MAGEGQVDDRTVADQEAAAAAQAAELEAQNTGAGDHPADDQDQTHEAAGAVTEIDFSKIDPNDPDALGALTDEQLTAFEKYNTEHPTPEPGTEMETPEPTAEEAAAAAAEKAQADATKYAGKYATTDALAQGVTEIAKKLGVDATAFVEAAKTSGEFKTLEALYKQLEKTLSVQGSHPAQSPDGKTTPAPGTDTAAGSFNPADPQVTGAVDQLTRSQLASSILAQRFAAKGLKLPANMEEFDALADVNPFFASEFKSAYQELFRANIEEAKGFYEASKTVETSNAGVVDTDSQAIKALAKEQGFKITDEEIAAAKTAALANPFNYETKYGHKFLRANAVRDQFLVSSLPGKLAEIKLTHTAAGRQQAVADLEKAGKREVHSLGTSKLSSKTRTIQKMPDLNDPDVVAGLPDEALNDPEGYFRKQGFVK